MKKISLGGVGGCELALAIRMFDQHSFPYDWLITSQSFILQSFNDFSKFFEFNEEYVYDQSKLLEKNKKAIMLHDFNDFSLQKDNVMEKYLRRFDRLNSALTDANDASILFIRINDNLEEILSPPLYYDHIFNREEEDLEIWNEFMKNISKKYKKTCTLLFISSHHQHNKSHSNNNQTLDHVIVRYTTHHKIPEKLYEIIANVERDLV